MSNARANDMVRRLTECGGLLDYGVDNSHLLVHVLRALAAGRPVTGAQVDQMVAGLGRDREAAEQFLRQITERDAEDNIVGALGLSLKQHPHRFTVNGVQMTAWCAQDTLFLPALLQQAAIVESESPFSKEPIRLTVGPDDVKEVTPASAVLSTVILDPDTADFGSPEAIMMSFCRNIHFFASADEVESWAKGRDDIETLTLEEGFELGRRMWPEAHAYAGALETADA